MNQSGTNCTLTLTKGINDLPYIAEQLSIFLKEYEILINPVNLMIEELYSNTIYYGNAEPLNVNIHLKINNETLEVVYEDNGKPFNPLIETEPPNLNQSIEDRQIGGLGIHFIKNMTDHQSYQRTNSLNQLTLKKKITPSTHAKR